MISPSMLAYPLTKSWCGSHLYLVKTGASLREAFLERQGDCGRGTVPSQVAPVRLYAHVLKSAPAWRPISLPCHSVGGVAVGVWIGRSEWRR